VSLRTTLLVACCAAAVWAATPLQATDRRAAREAARTFEQIYKAGVTPATVAALEALALHDSPISVDAVLRLFARREYALWRTARQVLAGFTSPQSHAYIVEKGLGHGDGVVRAQVLEALALSRQPQLDIRAQLRTSLDDSSPWVRAVAIRSIGRLRLADLTGAVLEHVGDPSEIVRAAVPESLVRLAGARSLAVLEDLATDPAWRVRLATIAAFADAKTVTGVEQLVEVLAREQGRLREDALAALQRLTGRPYGSEPELWEKFLATAPADFLARADTTALTPPRYEGGVSYHDIHSASQRFVFITDLSGSMAEQVVATDSYGTPGSRLSIAAGELLRLIATLDDEFAFNLITFADTSHAWKRTLIPANGKNRRAARTAIGNYAANGGTNVHAGLSAAWDMAEKSLDGHGSDRHDLVDIDTVFLLTDGAPTEGHIQTPRLLVEEARERNRWLQLRIHCVSLTTQLSNIEFLQALADTTLGQYVEKVADR
jgi:HEAT repeat protein